MTQKKSATETCAGCGAEAASHPYVGVGRAELGANQGSMMPHPVCLECWRDPAHRTRPLKVHFFERAAAPVAVAAAILSEEMAKQGKEIRLK